MKAIPYTCALAFAITPAFAGEPEPSPAPMPPSAPTYDYRWFLGAGGEYMIDAEEAFWNGHFGYNFNAANALFIESGWIGRAGESVNYDVDIVPITLDYKYTWAFTEKLGWYIGGGAGAAYVDIELPFGLGDEDWSFMLQAFTGLVYKVTPQFELYAGVRYMWIDDTDVFGVSIDDLDDWGVGGGLRFNF